MRNKTILIIDDDSDVRSLMSGVLSDEGYKTSLAKNGQEALSLIKESSPDLVFLDLWIEEDEAAGLKILKKIQKINPEIPVVIISGHGTIDIAVQAIQKGAFDFIEKPFVIDRLLITCKRAFEIVKLRKENFTLKHSKLDYNVFFVGTSTFSTSIKSTLKDIASTNSRVFIESKVGIGADAIAFKIHKDSQRGNRAFISVNCSSNDSKELEEKLFGTEKSRGCIENANFGTLFLEEVTRLTKSLQLKLLRFIQCGSYLAESREVYSDVKLICSSSEDIEYLLSSGKLSRELFYRVNVISLNIPSIKDRKEDILPIVDYYLSNSKIIFGMETKRFTKDALAILQSYDWPGNILQIKNVVENSLINAEKFSEIARTLLSSELTASAKEKFNYLGIAKLISFPIKEAREHFEHDYLVAQIDRFSGNISRASEFIGMERSALHRKLKLFGIKYDRIKKTTII